MVGRMTVVAITVCLLGGMAPAASKSKRKADKKKQIVTMIFKGTWKGVAKFEVGKSSGSSSNWEITFGDDFSQVSGIAINKLKKARLFNISIAKRSVFFILTYGVQNTNWTITCRNCKFNAAFTKITGTFKNIMGAGSFELTKQDLIAPADKLKGEWSGTAIGTKGKLAKKSGEMKLSLAAGTLSGAPVVFLPEKFTSVRVEPAGWNEDTRKMKFVLIYKKGKKSERVIFFTGTFNEGFTELEGTFDGQKAGKGTFKLSKALPLEEKKRQGDDDEIRNRNKSGGGDGNSLRLEFGL